jgi:Protein involved in formate dehydrogenase formation
VAKGSRPRKSSQPKTSSRGLSPKGTVPVSTSAPIRSSRNSNKPPAIDPLELFVTLVAGEENLSVNEARALLRLRRAQLAAREGAKGALLKLELNNGKLDLLATVGQSQLLPDVFKLMVLEFMDSFPARTRQLRALLRAPSLESNLQLVTPDRVAHSREDSHVPQSIFWAAAKPILESLAAGLLRHRKAALPVSDVCPLCGGHPYGRQGAHLLCALCETRWRGKNDSAPILGTGLEAFHTQPLLALIRKLSV